MCAAFGVNAAAAVIDEYCWADANWTGTHWHIVPRKYCTSTGCYRSGNPYEENRASGPETRCCSRCTEGSGGPASAAEACLSSGASPPPREGVSPGTALAPAAPREAALFRSPVNSVCASDRPVKETWAAKPVKWAPVTKECKDTLTSIYLLICIL